ncbi:MAG: M64 family metallopeptidase [Odoribacter sp.]|nr:M64 family metallopeptidase [Odoribacter sp.]
MKKLLIYIFIILSFMAPVHITAQPEGLYLYNVNRTINFNDIGKITFEYVDGRYIMNIGQVSMPIDDVHAMLYIKPDFELDLRDNSLHVDEENRQLTVGLNDVNFLPIELLSDTPDWLDIDIWPYGVELHIAANSGTVAREADITIGYSGYTKKETMHIVQEPFVFFSGEMQLPDYHILEYWDSDDQSTMFLSDGKSFTFKFHPGVKGTLKAVSLANGDLYTSDINETGVTADFNTDKGTVDLHFPENNSDNRCTYDVVLSFGNCEYGIRFTQMAKGEALPTPSIEIDTPDLYFDKVERTHSVFYRASSEKVKFGILSELPSWIQVKAIDNLHVELALKENTGETRREADIMIGDDQFGISETMHIVQEPFVFFSGEMQLPDYHILECWDSDDQSTMFLSDGKSFTFKFHPGVKGTLKAVSLANGDLYTSDINETGVTADFNTDKGTVDLHFPENNSDNRCTYDVVLSFGNCEYGIRFTQMAKGEALPTPSIEIDTPDLYFDKVERTHSVFYRASSEKVKFGILSELPSWIQVKAIDNLHVELALKENTGETRREADIMIGDDQFEISETLHIVQEPFVFFSGEMQPIGYNILERSEPSEQDLWMQPSGDTFTFNCHKGIEGKLTYAYHVQGDNFTDGTENIVFNVNFHPDQGSFDVIFPENHGPERLIGMEIHFGSCKYELRFKQAAAGYPSYAEQRQALIDLYNATNGTAWAENENWLSDKHLSQWARIRGNGRYVTHIDLVSNEIIGEIPCKALEILIHAPVHFNIGGNGLYGELSDELQALDAWQTAGFNVLPQCPWLSGQRRLTNYKHNLRIPDLEIEYLLGGEISSLYNLLSKHDLNWWGISAPGEYQVNQQLSYPGKYHHIAGVLSVFDSRETLEENARNNEFKDITYIFNCNAIRAYIPLGNLGTQALIDKDGYLIDVFYKNWSVPEAFEHAAIDNILSEYFGEPAEHEWFSYTNTGNPVDKSTDGHYHCLQKATVGKGIDIVLMGDGFSSEFDWVEGDYGTTMREAMENIFAEEPFKTFRDRFNVYMVHAVSEGQAGSGNAAINEDDNICRKYASVIPGIDLSKATIIDIANRKFWNPSGYTNINISDGSVIHMTNGSASSRELIHEMGHGFGLMLDEYIVGAHGGETVNDENRETFNQWMESQHAAGIGLNIDNTDNPAEILWAHILSDPRYTGQVGIYRGAYKYPLDLWRSEENGMMNSNYDNNTFNVVHREIIFKRIMKLSEGESWIYNYEEFVKYDSINRQ